MRGTIKLRFQSCVFRGHAAFDPPRADDRKLTTDDRTYSVAINRHMLVIFL